MRKKPPDPAALVEEHAPLTPEQEAIRRRAIAGEREKTKQERDIARAYQAQIADLERALGAALSLDGRRASPEIKGRVRYGHDQATACALISDLHVEERVDRARMNGLNEYSPTIAQKRLERVVKGLLYLVESHRAVTRIENVVLFVLGDIINGWLREESVATNYMPPGEAVVFAFDLLLAAIRYIRKHEKDLKVTVVCKRGNHGRMTEKTHIQDPEHTSLEWVIYQMLARALADDPKVGFVVEPGYFTFFQLYDKVIRAHHGDFVRYKDGVGGLTVPLNKRIAKWNVGRRADLDVMGHWHTLFFGGSFIVNGSGIGYDPFAESIGASPEPPQQAFFLMRPERGVSAFAPIFAE
jgi:hypothetical protein